MTTAMRDVPRTRNRDERQGTAIVVGASLAGLMTALALSHAGVDVTMLERSGAAPRARKGAALGGVSEGLLSRITGSRHAQSGSAPLSSVAPGVQSWMAVHARLRGAVDADPHIELRPRTIVRSVDVRCERRRGCALSSGVAGPGSDQQDWAGRWGATGDGSRADPMGRARRASRAVWGWRRSPLRRRVDVVEAWGVLSAWVFAVAGGLLAGLKRRVRWSAAWSGIGRNAVRSRRCSPRTRRTGSPRRRWTAIGCGDGLEHVGRHGAYGPDQGAGRDPGRHPGDGVDGPARRTDVQACHAPGGTGTDRAGGCRRRDGRGRGRAVRRRGRAGRARPAAYDGMGRRVAPDRYASASESSRTPASGILRPVRSAPVSTPTR